MNLNPCPDRPQPENLTLVAGQNLDWNALRLLPEAMPYLILETAEYGIQFTSAANDFNRDLTVLRLHAFGLGGDFQARVDERRVHWRFVGERDIFDQLGLDAVEDDFYPESEKLSTRDPETALLWGKHDEERGQRHEARMGGAYLDYPGISLEVERVNICACPVLAPDHRVIAYWTYALTEHQPESLKGARS